MTHETHTPEALRPTERRTIVLLLVDDQPFVGAVLGGLLATEEDMELHCCYQSLDAVATASQIRPTIILQDLVLPGLDGFTLIRMFRANPATATTPIVALSGNDDDETRRRAMADGATDFVVKLPGKGELLACLRRHAHQKPAAALRIAASVPAFIAKEPPVQSLDRSILAGFRDLGGSEFVSELIDQFVQEARSQVEALREAGRHRNSDGVKRAAHALKGSSMTMGANQLAALCAQLEDDASEYTALLDLTAECACELVRVQQALEAERRSVA